MIERLWWKDARQFWPIWGVLVAAAGVAQWLALRYAGQDARQGVLVLAAIGWTALYAFAVGSAAFAGETENKTLGFLDTLPVGRGVLWGGKVSFAVATTLGLAVVLAALAWTGSDRLPFVDGHGDVSGRSGREIWIVVEVAVMLTEALGWGLFWSSVSGNALAAAVLAMGSVFVSLMSAGPMNDPSAILYGNTPVRFAAAVAASAASGLVVVLGDRLWRALAAASGVVVVLGEGVWGELTRRRSIVPLNMVKVEALRRGRPTPLTPEVQVLAWQTARQAWPTWWRLAVIGLVLPALLKAGGARIDLGVVIALNVVLGLLAGVNVFNAENRGGTRSFLANHGARPGVVWGVKLGVWAAWLAFTWGVLAAASFATWGNPPSNTLPLFLIVVTIPMAVGQVCGMVIPRGITAAVAAVVGALAVVVPSSGLWSWGLRSDAAGLLLPVALLAVSWAWSADWLFDRPGLARWGRLAGLLTVALGVVFGVYAGDRAWGVSEVKPRFDAAAFARGAAVEDKDNAAELYREAGQILLGLRRQVLSVDKAGNPVTETRRPLDDRERAEVVDLARRGSRLPVCRFVKLDRAAVDLRASVGSELNGIAALVAEAVDSERKEGDLGGAWDDLMVLFRIARQTTGPVPMAEAVRGLSVERKGLDRALKWAADPRQSSRTIRSALVAYKAFLPMPTSVETLAAEQVVTENMLRLPAEELAMVVDQTLRKERQLGLSPADTFQRAAFTSPWEVERARRVVGQVFQVFKAGAAREPSARNASAPDLWWTESGRQVRDLTEGAPLIRSVCWAAGAIPGMNDRNEVMRRALVQILALRHWQLTHDGTLPDQLDELVQAGEIDTLPTDPYSGRAFGYALAQGQGLILDANVSPRAWDVGQRLLYSVGPDQVDHQGRYSNVEGSNGGDLVFPLPTK